MPLWSPSAVVATFLLPLSPQGAVGMTTAETVFSALTVPLPTCLNMYWFCLIVRKGWRMANPKKGGKAERKARRDR